MLSSLVRNHVYMSALSAVETGLDRPHRLVWEDFIIQRWSKREGYYIDLQQPLLDVDICIRNTLLIWCVVS